MPSHGILAHLLENAHYMLPPIRTFFFVFLKHLKIHFYLHAIDGKTVTQSEILFNTFYINLDGKTEVIIPNL